PAHRPPRSAPRQQRDESAALDVTPAYCRKHQQQHDREPQDPPPTRLQVLGARGAAARVIHPLLRPIPNWGDVRSTAWAPHIEFFGLGAAPPMPDIITVVQGRMQTNSGPLPFLAP